MNTTYYLMSTNEQNVACMDRYVLDCQQKSAKFPPQSLPCSAYFVASFLINTHPFIPAANFLSPI
jgi:hypothetical protein